jgi:inner membrane protein
MPSSFTHAIVGVGLAEIARPRPMPALYWALAAGLAMLPDVDVLAFSFGIPYGARFGHRGFSHSLFCALVFTLPVALLSARPLGLLWWFLWGFFFVVMASHGVLDAFTNGGMGIALLAPFDPTRYFFPWQPIQVAPIGMGFFSRWGLHALFTEFLWVWIPTAALVALTWVYRKTFGYGPEA